MSDTMLLIFGSLITVMLIGGILFSLLEFKRMHDNPRPENITDRVPPTNTKSKQNTRVAKDEY
ncbi:MAG: hypothetical protein RMI34_06105 [Chloroherpetonaceae bacterium]|nr:hypothetical protein [Chloroherpetonaceae bacterium]MCS7210522.1 hypothetical protein [Chloroherpetonaceae bacterium]MDW8019632.1 hypothetical protein [Chloroherpetonaceae bacterium]